MKPQEQAKPGRVGLALERIVCAGCGYHFVGEEGREHKLCDKCLELVNGRPVSWQ